MLPSRAALPGGSREGEKRVRVLGICSPLI